MRAEIRSIYSTDVDDLDGYRPSDAAFCVPVRFLIGPAGAIGEESFDVLVCSPRWLGQQLELAPVYAPRHHLIVKYFDFAAVRRYVEGRVAQCSGTTWTEVAEQLARLGYWEFEDYA